MIKIEHLVTCLATMAYVYTECAVRVTIFSTGSKFQLVSNFTELHALTLAACSYCMSTIAMSAHVSCSSG